MNCPSSIRKMKCASILILLIGLLLSGCLIEKRHYRNGYYVNFQGNSGSKVNNQHTRSSVTESSMTNSDTAIIGSAVSGDILLPESSVDDTASIVTVVDCNVNDSLSVEGIANDTYESKTTTRNIPHRRDQMPYMPGSWHIWFVLFAITLILLMLSLGSGMMLVLFGILVMIEMWGLAMIIARALRKTGEPLIDNPTGKKISLYLAVASVVSLAGIFIAFTFFIEIAIFVCFGLALILTLLAAWFSLKYGNTYIRVKHERKKWSIERKLRFYLYLAILGLILIAAAIFVYTLYVPIGYFIILASAATIIALCSLIVVRKFQKFGPLAATPEIAGKWKRLCVPTLVINLVTLSVSAIILLLVLAFIILFWGWIFG